MCESSSRKSSMYKRVHQSQRTEMRCCLPPPNLTHSWENQRQKLRAKKRYSRLKREERETEGFDWCCMWKARKGPKQTSSSGGKWHALLEWPPHSGALTTTRIFWTPLAGLSRVWQLRDPTPALECLWVPPPCLSYFCSVNLCLLAQSAFLIYPSRPRADSVLEHACLRECTAFVKRKCSCVLVCPDVRACV